jgi:myo-inositol-1(or 4)-monophosphatase
MALVSSNLSIMQVAAEKAARSLLRDFNEVEHLQVSIKGPHNFVSAADKRAEEIIYKELQKSRPTYGYLMEESGAVQGEDPEHVFVIDPLDGTSNFLHGIPHWCISIGLIKSGEPVAGVVYDPVRDEMFSAEKGGGAFLRKRRLRVSGRRDLAVARVGTEMPTASSKTYKEDLATIGKLQDAAVDLCSLRASALDLAYVAAGRLDACLHLRYKAWDYAAGTCLVREAGGFVHSLSDKNSDPVTSGKAVAGNGAIDQTLLKIVRS